MPGGREGRVREVNEEQEGMDGNEEKGRIGVSERYKKVQFFFL